MFKKLKDLKITFFQIVSVSLVALIATIRGIVIFSSIIDTNNVVINLLKVLILVISVWNIIFAIIDISTMLESKRKWRNIFRETFTYESYTFQMAICVIITTFILLLLITIGLCI